MNAIEEKLEEAKRLYKDANADQRYVLESLFPELAESEDVRIRKEIVSAINIYCTEYLRGTKVRNDMLAWLEKQGGQKSTREALMLERHECYRRKNGRRNK